MCFKQGFDRKDMGERLALVVVGAAAEDLPVDDGRFERGRAPLADRVDRLNVVMSVDQNRRRAGDFGRLTENKRVCLRLDDIGGKPEFAVENVGEPFGHPAHVRFMLRLGADARNPKRFEPRV